MDYHGLIQKFPLNRPLSDFEIRAQLRLNAPPRNKPWGMGSVIKMNSTYLECVDKFYEDKGIISASGLVFVGMFIIFALLFTFDTIDAWADRTPETRRENLYFLAFVLVVLLGGIIYFGSFLRHELFRHTHYPIRFNRKNRMVYVTRLDGTVMAESWDKLFFTEGQCGGRAIGFGEIRDVRGHRLAEDGNTVLDSFALPYYSDVKFNFRFCLWEFIRIYMENGPADLMRRVEKVNDVADRREGFMTGWKLHHNFIFNHVGFLAYVVFPITLWYAAGRWIAMRTSKIPVWPSEVESACLIEPNDPYIIDRDHPPVELDEPDEPLVVDGEKELDDLLKELDETLESLKKPDARIDKLNE